MNIDYCSQPWRLKSQLYKQSPPTRTHSSVGFACVAVTSTRLVQDINSLQHLCASVDMTI